jgi:hypothetical protein
MMDMIIAYTVNANTSPNQSIDNTVIAGSDNPQPKRKFRQNKYLSSDELKETTAGVSTSINNDVEFDNLLDYVDQDSEVLAIMPNNKSSLRMDEEWHNKLRSVSQIESTYSLNNSVDVSDGQQP